MGSLRRLHAVRGTLVLISIGVIALVFGLLGLDRLQRMTIGLNLRVGEVAFRSSTVQPLSSRVRVSRFDLDSVPAFRLPRPIGRRENSNLSLAAVVQNGDTGFVSLDALVADSAAQVVLSHRGDGHYAMEIAKLASDVTLTLRGPVRVTTAGVDSVFDFPTRKVTVPTPERVDADLVLEAGRSFTFFPAFYVDSLDFVRTVVFASDTVVLRREVSSIESGSYTLESLSGEEYNVAPGQWIEFGTSSGVLRRLRLGAEDLEVGFFGEVTDMRAGARDVRRSLMPSHLDWLRARQTLGTILGASLALVGLLNGFGVFDGIAKLWRRAR